MIYYIAHAVKSTDDASDAYIQLNNCGWYEKCDTKVHTRRPNGRADYQVIYIKSGMMQFGEERYDAGTLYIFRPYEPQDYHVVAENTDFYWIHFTGTAADAIFAADTQKAYQIGYCEAFINFCRETVMSYTNTALENSFYVQGRLLSTIASLPPANQSSAPDTIDNAITYMHEYYTKKLTNDELAKLCGLSKYHFIRKFTQKTGKTPQKYHTDLLLTKSLTMLTDTNLKIADIADSLGFEDSLYFSRIFKKTYGMSPKEYRTTH